MFKGGDGLWLQVGGGRMDLQSGNGEEKKGRAQKSSNGGFRCHLSPLRGG